MSRNQRWLAYLVALLIALPLPARAYSQTSDKSDSPYQPIQVLSITQVVGDNMAIVQFDKHHRLPFPIMHYLPASTGKVLAIDFQHAALACPQVDFHYPHSSIPGLSIVQWQVFPPVVRLLFEASDDQAYKSVALESTKGRLLIRLPGARKALGERAYDQPGAGRPNPAPELPSDAQTSIRPNVAQTIPPTAPDIARTPRAARPILRDPILLPQPDDASYSIAAKPEEPACKPRTAGATTAKAPADAAQTQQVVANDDGQDAVAPAAKRRGVKQALKRFFRIGSANRSQENPEAAAQNSPPQSTSPQKITLNESNPATCKLELVVPPSTTTFRLHDPERYVIDMPAVDKKKIAVPHLPPDSLCIKGLRVGSQENSPDTARIVLDLTGEDVEVAEQQNAEHHLLTLVLSKPQSQTPEHRAISDTHHLPTGCVVLLDAGHGGSDPGAQRGDIQEKELTLAIVEKLKHVLESENIHVKLTRADDTFVSLEDRVKLTNELKPDVFLSVHINSLEANTQATGIETYYQSDISRDLAQLIHTYLVKELGAPDRNVRRARFYVINHTPYPSVLAEVGFISNKEERDKLASSDYQLEVARALADGLVSYLSERSQSNAYAKPSTAVGTISALPPSSPPSSLPAHSAAAPPAAPQSFTQNLQLQRAWLPAAQTPKP